MCCGIDDVADWRQTGVDFGFPSGYNKPAGCCFKNRTGTELNEAQKDVMCSIHILIMFYAYYLYRFVVNQRRVL